MYFEQQQRRGTFEFALRRHQAQARHRMARRIGGEVLFDPRITVDAGEITGLWRDNLAKAETARRRVHQITHSVDARRISNNIHQ